MKERKNIDKNAQKKVQMNNLVEVYEKKGCNISATCKALGISRQTFYNWKNNVQKIQEGIDEADESLIDFAETQLISLINEGNLNAITFYLRAKGKDRGYADFKKVDFTGSGVDRVVYISKEQEEETDRHIDEIIESSINGN